MNDTSKEPTRGVGGEDFSVARDLSPGVRAEDIVAGQSSAAKETHHPLPTVLLRAGWMACREYMARFVEQGGDPTTAASIRANWWPAFGDDPGVPRLFDFDELCDWPDDSEKARATFIPDVNREAAVEACVLLQLVETGQTEAFYRNEQHPDWEAHRRPVARLYPADKNCWDPRTWAARTEGGSASPQTSGPASDRNPS